MPVLGLVVCKRLDKVLLPQAVFIEGGRESRLSDHAWCQEASPEGVLCLTPLSQQLRPPKPTRPHAASSSMAGAGAQPAPWDRGGCCCARSIACCPGAENPPCAAGREASPEPSRSICACVPMRVYAFAC